MGWMCSWVGVRAPQAGVLEALDFVRTGEPAQPGSRGARFSVAEIPDGWTIVFSEDFEWVGRIDAAALSALGDVLGCKFEDKVDMATAAFLVRGGREIWRVEHENDLDRLVVVTGEPPPLFETLRDALWRKQEADDGVDYLHDLPLDLAKAICGFRVDDDDELEFEAVRPRNAPVKAAAAAKKGGFLARLFGRA